MREEQALDNMFQVSVGIDLGGANTGVVIAHQVNDEPLKPENIKAFTVVMPKDGDALTFSTKSRTAVRHRIRGNKRYQMVRRLAFLIINEQLKNKSVNLSEDEDRKMREAVAGLLLRRGYTYIDGGADLECCKNIDVELFANHEVLGKYFHVGEGSLLDQFEALANDLDQVLEFCSDVKELDKKGFGGYVKECTKDDLSFDKERRSAVSSAYAAIKDAADKIRQEEGLGHKHRSKYLEAIHNDLTQRNDTRLTAVKEAFGGTERFYRLIGNLSNLQLRAERWYFNSKDMVNGDKWDAERLQLILVRAFKYFHPGQNRSTAEEKLEERRRIANVIKTFETSKDIVDTLCSLDPNDTIPPYEDQNNRRPPVDQTLLLNPDALNRLYGNKWLEWTLRFIEKDPSLAAGLETIASKTDRKSRLDHVRENRKDEPQLYVHAYALQRVFDASVRTDAYQIRALSKKHSEEISQGSLVQLLGAADAKVFLGCARKYYGEVDDAKTGIWQQSCESLLERSDLHPPMKKKILNLLVGNILGRDDKLGCTFITDVWHEKPVFEVVGKKSKKIKNRRSVCSICEFIESERKKLGNAFNRYYQKATGKLDPESDQDWFMFQIHQYVRGVSAFIGQALGLSQNDIGKFANPYSLAQLYTLIETEPDGFASNTVSVNLENAFRMQRVRIEDRKGREYEGCRYSRLPADSTRPFDGMVCKVLDREAWEVAKRVIDLVKNQVHFEHGQVKIPVMIEENSFEFSASIADIKKLPKTDVDKKLDRVKEHEALFQDKNERIKADTLGVSAYSGESLLGQGEIDHILPRSRTLKEFGMVLNGEANLIYVSRNDNQRKREQTYSLDNIADSYLNLLFKTSDRHKIEELITDRVTTMQKHGRLKQSVFEGMNQSDRNCIRFALFLDPENAAYQAVVEMLMNRSKTLVNGTQKWFMRNFMQKVQQHLGEWCDQSGNRLVFKLQGVPPATELRHDWAAINSDIKKKHPQPLASHSIDAMCVMVTGLDQLNKTYEYSKVDKLAELYPYECEIVNVKRKALDEKSNKGGVPLFKEGIYADNFLPLFSDRGDLYVGYEMNAALNADPKCSFKVKVEGKEPVALLKALESYLDKPVNPDLNHHVLYQFDKMKVRKLFAQVATSQADEALIKSAELIRKFAYYTIKKPLESVFTDKGNFNAKLNLASSLSLSVKISEKKLYSVGGKILLPIYVEWNRFYEIVKSHVSNGQKNIGELVKNAWFKTKSSKNEHAPVKRVYSLPFLPKSVDPSIYIHRKSINNDEVYQVYSPNGRTKGFLLNTKGSVNFKAPMLFDYLKNNSAFSSKMNYIAGQTISTQEWRKVFDSQAIRIWYAPVEEKRFHVRVELPFEVYKTITKYTGSGLNIFFGDVDKNKSKKDDPEMENKKKKILFKDRVSPDISKYISQPRTGVLLEKAGNVVKISYTAASTTEFMRDLFNHPLEDN